MSKSRRKWKDLDLVQVRVLVRSLIDEAILDGRYGVIRDVFVSRQPSERKK